MDWIRLSRIFTVLFTIIATALNWDDLGDLQRILYPLWIFGLCLPNLD